MTSFTALIILATLGKLASINELAYGKGVSAVVILIIGASKKSKASF
jgi:hypothetical protein